MPTLKYEKLKNNSAYGVVIKQRTAAATDAGGQTTAVGGFSSVADSLTGGAISADTLRGTQAAALAGGASDGGLAPVGTWPTFTGLLMEAPSIGTHANYADFKDIMGPFTNSLVQSLGGSARAAGFLQGAANLGAPFITQSAWTGTELIEISLKIGYLAVKNPKVDVLDPIAKLLALPLGIVAGREINVPTFGGALLDLEVGNWLVVSKLVPVNVQADFEHAMTRGGGRPISGTVTMTLRTHKAIGKDEIVTWFK